MRDYLVFWVGDGGDRESCSVFYSNIISASSKTNAIEGYIRYTHDIDNLIDLEEYMEENEILLSDYDTLKCEELKIVGVN